MEKSSFEKFKDVIRKHIRAENEVLKDLLAKRQEVYQKIVKSVEGEPNVIGVKLNGDRLEILINGRSKQIEQKVLKKYGELLDEYDYIMNEIEQANFILYRFRSLVSSFDNDKAINVNDKLHEILAGLLIFYNTGSISLEDFNTILGSSVHLASKKRNENPTTLEETAVRLAKFYNIYGEFLLCTDDSYLEAFDNLFIAMFKNTAFVITLDNFEKTLGLSQKLDNLYQEYCAKCSVKPIVSIKDDSIKEDYCSPIIQETDSSNDFETTKEEIKNFDLELWQQASLKVQELKPYDKKRIELLEVLKEISLIKSLYLETNDSEDKLYLEEELAGLFEKLALLLEEKEEKISDNNLVFLTDKSGICYFSEDVMALDKGIRKRTYSLLNKIKVENARQFNKLPIDDYNIFQVLNKDVQILFLELYPGVYMIIGTCIIGRKNIDIVNRVNNPINKKYIEKLMLMVKDEDFRRKLLNEHTVYALTDALNRTRENIDNN